MRPIKLTLKGLHSFIEEQTIDFDVLCSRGLFGIFGPTGSGKSTILDGITLALYGEISRKSNTFINTNVETCSVSFEFQLSGKTSKHYRVERRFKRDKNSGNSRGDSALLIDMTYGEPLILSDRITHVTKECEHIIGLGIDDFTRTVVLPQGKFSEFLKLEGRQRRDMLERLFGLEAYGDSLSAHLSSSISKEKEAITLLTGELKGFEGICEEALAIKTAEFEQYKTILHEKTIEHDAATFAYKQGEQLYQVQLELLEFKRQQAKHQEQTEVIAGWEARIKQAEISNVVMPYVRAYELTNQTYTKQSELFSTLQIKLSALSLQKITSEQLFQTLSKQKEEELPAFQRKEQVLLDALVEQANLRQLQKEDQGLFEKQESMQKECLVAQDVLVRAKSTYAEKEKERTLFEEQKEACEVSDSLRVLVQQGKNWEDNITQLEESLNKETKKHQLLQTQQERESSDLVALVQQKKELLLSSTQTEQELCDTLGTMPDRALVYGQEKTLQNKQEQWKICKELDQKLSILQETLHQLEHSMVTHANQMEAIRGELEIQQAEFHQKNTANLASKLRNELVEHEPCPVCGSVNHDSLNGMVEDQGELLALEKNITANTSSLKLLEGEWIRFSANKDQSSTLLLELQTTRASYDVDQMVIDTLEEKFQKQKVLLESLDTLKTTLEEKKQAQVQELGKIDVRLAVIEAQIVARQLQLVELSKIIKEVQNTLHVTRETLDDLKSSSLIDQFKEKSLEIRRLDQTRGEVELAIKQNRIALEASRLAIEQKTSLLHIQAQSLVALQSERQAKRIAIQEKEAWISRKVGENTSLEVLLIQVQEAMLVLTRALDAASAKNAELTQSHQKSNDEMIALTAMLHEIRGRLADEKRTLEEVLVREGVKDVLALNDSVMKETQMQEVSLKIQAYHARALELQGLIANLQRKSNHQSMSEEQWRLLQQSKEDTKLALDVAQTTLTKKQWELADVKEKLASLLVLLQTKKELDRKFALLSDLEKLFKGKKFVEFAAMNQLQYVSMEADARLKEITSGSYGLEIDEVGKFIIRDYKNGGVARDTSTLSGGETFLASLSLALALSAQIQLKGTAPLELFFLDEGFGTLDDAYLEVVMESLERIHNDKLKIGIISHVESIKNRIPIKLLVKPALAGEGGSKVSIELT